MAATDARPVPKKNVAYRVYFPILDADGDLVTGAADLDSERSLDGATFADCTNEATEVATSSGIYFLDLTATEMNTDNTFVIVKTSTAGAKTTPISLYPEEAGDIRVNVTQVSDDATAADNLELDYDGTGFNKSSSTIGTTTTNSDMRGTDSAALASVATETRLAELDAANIPADIAAVKAETALIVADTDEIQGKLPDNKIMGSGVTTNKDDEIDAIKAKTDNLPADPASDTNVNANETKIDAVKVDTAAILIDTNEVQGKLPTDNIMGSAVLTSKDDEIDAIKTKTDNLPTDPASETNVNANETKIDAVKVDTAAILIDTAAGGAGPWTTGSGGTNPTILQNTTIATLSTQKIFTLTAGSADDDAYNGSMIVIEDSATATQKARGLVLSYVGATKTITLVEDPGVFTMAVGDTVDIVAIMTKKEMAQAQRDQAIFDTNLNKSSNMGVLRPLIGLGAFNERTGITSEDITKSSEARAILFSTLTDTVTDPEETFGGSFLRYKDQDESPFVAKGGYFYTDSTNTVSQIWGIAADMGFANGVQTNPASTAGWAGTDTLEDGDGNGWTFLGEAMGEDFNHSGSAMEIRKIGSGASAGSASVTTTADAIVLQNTTIATLATQLSFTLTAGSADNDAYNGAVIVIKDSATAEQKAVGVVSDYVGSTKTITLLNDPAVFTMAVGDTIDILADRSLKPATDNATLTVASGRADADMKALNAVTGSAADLEQAAAAIETGAAIAGTLSTTEMTTDLTETTNNHFVGLVVKWTTGVLAKQGTEITAYDGATKKLTYTTVTDSPAATDKFVIN